MISKIATAKNLLENYEIHIVSVIGVLFNFHSLFIIKNYIPNFKFYDFFLCRCVCNLVVCFFGIFFKPALIESIICEECMRPSYLQLYLQAYFVCIPLRIAFLSSAVSDILLIMNRVALLYYRHLSAYNRNWKLSCFVKRLYLPILLWIIKFFTSFFTLLQG